MEMFKYFPCFCNHNHPISLKKYLLLFELFGFLLPPSLKTPNRRGWPLGSSSCNCVMLAIADIVGLQPQKSVCLRLIRPEVPEGAQKLACHVAQTNRSVIWGQSGTIGTSFLKTGMCLECCPGQPLPVCVSACWARSAKIYKGLHRALVSNSV